MKTKQMPVGNPIYFEGDPTNYVRINDHIFFAEVDVIAPKNINVPILPFKLKISESNTRTVTPLGN
jgi:hypothetical protein